VVGQIPVGRSNFEKCGIELKPILKRNGLFVLKVIKCIRGRSSS
jgi:hypothetical protein